MRKGHIIVSILILVSLILVACTPATTTNSSSTDDAAAPVEASVLPILKVTALPIIDALPIFVAQQEGLFEKAGVQVEFVPVASAPERDQLISVGQVDGMINETLSTFFFNKEQVQIKIVRYALKPTADSGHFFILASGQSGITTPDQLKGVEIGVSQGTVIEYVTYRLLQQNGLAKEDIKTIAVPKIPERMALLSSGELSAAVMPDPLAALAVQQGAKVVLDDSMYPQYGFSVYSFRTDSLDTKGDAVKAFLTGIEEAVAMINANPGGYTDILTEQNLVPAPLLATYSLPTFTAAGLPSEVEWNDAMQWAQEMGLLAVDVSYWDSVTGDYLPVSVAVPQ